MGQGRRAAEGVCGSDRESGSRGDGHCTALVKHLGAVLGLRGKEAYRRPGPGQPVWRKRETLIQERIVQYTTLDEEGTVSCRMYLRKGLPRLVECFPSAKLLTMPYMVSGSFQKTCCVLQRVAAGRDTYQFCFLGAQQSERYY